MSQSLNYFLPTWVLVWLCLCGLGFSIIGYRKTGLVVLAPAALHWLVFPAKSVVVDNTSLWLRLTVSFFFAAFILRAALTIIFGKEVAAQAVGQIVASTIMGAVRGLALLSRRLASFLNRGE